MSLSISVCEKVWPSGNKMGYHVVITDNDRYKTERSQYNLSAYGTSATFVSNNLNLT